MFEKIKVKKPKKAHIKDNRKESINYECPKSSDKNDILPAAKRKNNIQLESTGEDVTVKCDSNDTTVPLPLSVEYVSRKKLKKNKRKLETEADDINIIVKHAIEQTVDSTNKISKKKKKVNPTDDDVNTVDDKKGVAAKNEIIVETPSSLNVKAKRKKKKKKSGGNEMIIDEHENKEMDEFIGELDEESNAQYDNWVKEIDSIFKKSM